MSSSTSSARSLGLVVVAVGLARSVGLAAGTRRQGRAGGCRAAMRLGLLLLVAIQSGCGPGEQIQRYRAPKERRLVDSQPPEPQRLLAGLIPHERTLWSFRLSGPDAQVAPLAETFQSLLKSVRLSTQGEPTWTLPSGWQQQPGQGERYATLLITSPAGPLEVRVNRLPLPDIDETTLLLSNINRWRGQLGLPDISAAELPNHVTSLPIEEGGRAFYVNLASEGATGRAGGGTPSGGTAPQGSPTPAAAPLSYTTPEGWAAAPTSSIRAASFSVRDGSRRVEITAHRLGAAADVETIFNFWRQELRLPEASPEELRRQLRSTAVGPTAGEYIELTTAADAPNPLAIFGAVAIHGGTAWSFKLKGDRDLAVAERDRFLSFLQSVQFAPAQGAGDGK